MDALAKLEKAWDKITHNKSLQEEIDEEFAPKTFRDEWNDTYEEIKTWGFIPAIFSVCSSALTFLSAFVNLHWLFSVIIGLAVASLYEVLKNFTTQKGFYLFYKKKNAKLMPVAFAFVAGSVVLSVFGAYCAYEITEGETKQAVTQVTASERAMKVAEYDTLISEAKREAEAYKKGNMIRDVSGIDVLRSNATTTHNELVAKISELQKEKREALAKLDGTHQQTIGDAVDDLGPYLYLIIAFTLINEGVIVAMNWFKRYFRYRVSKEENIIYSDNQMIELPLKDVAVFVKNAIQTAMSGGVPSPTPPFQGIQQITPHTKPPIGFPTGPGGSHGQNQQQSPPPPVYQTVIKKVKDEKECGNPACKKLFTPKVPHQKYCSKKCNWDVNNFNKLAQKP